MKQLLLFPDYIPPDPGPPLLTGDQQRELLDSLAAGGSPQVACARLGVPRESFTRTLEEDAGFRRRLRCAREVMTHNVVATLYAAALKGTVSAQSLWLKTFPPAGSEPGAPGATADDQGIDDDLNALPDEALGKWLARFG